MTIATMKILTVAGGQFGTILVKQVMEENGHTVSEAEDHLAWLNLVCNIFGLIISLPIGYLCDHYAIYKLLTFINALILSTWYLMHLDIAQNQIGWKYDLGFIIALSTLHVSTLLGQALLGKICSENTRGTMFGFNGFFGSVGIAILQGTGGYLYNNFSKMGPIDIGYIC